MNSQLIKRVATGLLLLGAAACRDEITMEMVLRQLPLEGAPLAVKGSYATTIEPAFESPRHIVYRPTDLMAFPTLDQLPIVVWGHGGCAIEARQYDGFLQTVASHGFLVLATVGMESDEEGRMQDVEDLRSAIAWAEAENMRAGSPLQGKIDDDHVFVMGQSCGGFLAIALGSDPRVDTIAVFNAGVPAPSANAQRVFALANTDALGKLKGPALFINGGEVDFMRDPSRANFDLVNGVPAFYGSRDNAGHTATMMHPGGGEFANVASNWALYQLKSDAEAGKMFTGTNCGLCKLPTWETASK